MALPLALAGAFSLVLTKSKPSYAADAYADVAWAEQLPWYETLQVKALVDAYYSLNYNLPKPQTNVNGFRAYDTTNGFALAWAGLDAGYELDPVGATVSLRLGPKSHLHAGKCLSSDRGQNPCDVDVGLAFVKQAFVSLRPTGPSSGFQLDFGKFDSPVGAETADSLDNFNYTRGLLYSLAQPWFHTGLRAALEATPELRLEALLVNGWNNSVDNNAGKSVGFRAELSPAPSFRASLGWLGGPEQEDWIWVQCGPGTSFNESSHQCTPNAAATQTEWRRVDRGGANDFSAWRHLVDLVLSYRASQRADLLFNLNWGAEALRGPAEPGGVPTEVVTWYGAMLAGRYELSQTWAASARAEYFSDPNGRWTGLSDLKIASATLTIEAKWTEFFSLRLDNRGDLVLDGEPDTALFQHGPRGLTETQWTSTLGVVAVTN